MELTHKKKTAWKDNKKIMDFAEDYKVFLTAAKTERTATKEIITRLKKAGFKDAGSLNKLKKGDKVYFNQKDKSVIAVVIGDEHPLLVGSHIDSPRLDLKPNPLYEDKGIALLRTHYYGGIKKYQWTNVDLALYGVIFTKKGKKIEFELGEKDDEPRFLISDLLPHLSKKQMEKKGVEVIEGEQLNVFVGNTPVDDEDVKKKIKQNILEILNRKYGIIEEDFAFAELNLVPAGRPRDIGFDHSMISGYGHDDKACSYANLMALLDASSQHTMIAYFADKEEIGSMGNTGAYSYVLLDVAEDLVEKTGWKLSAKRLLRDAQAISADVGAAFNPAFADVHDKQNAALLGHGVVIEKYTGSGGKYSANDTSAEYMQEIRKLVDEHDIQWQAAEIGKVDIGGGGTIALYLSRFGMDTIDVGPAVLGMHSPREVISKADLYETYRLYKAFFESK